MGQEKIQASASYHGEGGFFCFKLLLPTMGRAILLFQTSASYHGDPCPEARSSLLLRHYKIL